MIGEAGVTHRAEDYDALGAAVLAVVEPIAMVTGFGGLSCSELNTYLTGLLVLADVGVVIDCMVEHIYGDTDEEDQHHIPQLHQMDHADVRAAATRWVQELDDARRG